MKLLHKFLLLTTLPLLIMFAALLFITSRITGESVVHEADFNAHRTLAFHANHIDQQFSAMTTHLKLLASGPVLRSGKLEAILPALRSWGETLSDQVEGLYFTDIEGIVHDADNKTFSVTDRYYYPQVLRGEVVVTKAIRSRATGQPIVLILVPIFDAHGKRIGAIGATIPIDTLLKYVRGIKAGPSGFAAMIDQDGRIVSGVTPVSTSDDVFADPSTFKNDPGLARLHKDVQSSSSGVVEFEYDGQPCRGYHQTLPSTGWSLVTIYKRNEILANLHRQQRLILYVAGAGLCIVIILTYFAHRTLIHPIQSLINAQQQISKGNLDTRSTVAQHDEVGQLAQSFNDMAAALQAADRKQAAEIVQRERAEYALRAGEERYRSLVNLLTSIVWTTDPTGQFISPQPSWERYTGQAWEVHRGLGWAQAFHPEDRPHILKRRDVALENKSHYTATGRIWHAASGQYRHFEAVGVALHNPDGSIREWVGTVTDIDERVRNEQRQKLLMSELDHRVKNNLAAVHGLAQQSLREAVSLESFRDSFSGRILAMARSHEALAASKWQGLDIASLVQVVTATFDTPEHPRIHLSGPPLTMPSRTILPLSLTLHELATNAVKYGSLSKENGSVSIRWQFNPAGDLTLQWIESGGPPVTPPAKPGLGTKLIRGLVGYELQGQVQLDYHPQGLTCRIMIPAATLTENAHETGARTA